MAVSISPTTATAPPKLLEYNADTPTSLYESAVLQWFWLEQMIARGELAEGRRSVQFAARKADRALARDRAGGLCILPA